MFKQAFLLLQTAILAADPSYFIEEWRGQPFALEEDDPLRYPAVLIEFGEAKLRMGKSCPFAEIDFTLHVCGEVLSLTHSDSANQTLGLDEVYAPIDTLIGQLLGLPNAIEIQTAQPSRLQERIYEHRISGKLTVGY